VLSVEYLAGFVDGEGHLSIARIARRDRPHEYCARVSITNANRPILDRIQRFSGGIFVSVGPRSPGWKPQYALVWTNAAAARLLTKVSPFLRVESKQAAALREFVFHVRGSRRRRDRLGRLLSLSGRELIIRDTFYRRLKLLNKRGSVSVSRGHDNTARKSESRTISSEYLAGFIDAEGCLMIARSESRRHRGLQYRARVCVSNTDRVILEDLQRAFGGILVNQPAAKIGWKHAYQLVWSDRMVEQLLLSALPYLQVKRRQAVVLLQFIKYKKRTRQGRNANGFAPLPRRVVATREALCRRMKELNAKGQRLGATKRQAREVVVGQARRP